MISQNFIATMSSLVMFLPFDFVGFFFVQLLYCHFWQLLLTASHLTITKLLTFPFFLDLVECKEKLWNVNNWSFLVSPRRSGAWQISNQSWKESSHSRKCRNPRSNPQTEKNMLNMKYRLWPTLILSQIRFSWNIFTSLSEAN